MNKPRVMSSKAASLYAAANGNLYSFSFLNQDKSTGHIPEADIFDVQLQLYKVNPDHHGAFHKHGSCINTPLPDVKIFGDGSTPNGFSNEVCLDKQTTNLLLLF